MGPTLQAWVTHVGLDLVKVGFFMLLNLPHAMKFLWAPFMDHFHPPVLQGRQGWLVVSQIFVFLSILGISFTNPIEVLFLFSIAAFLIAFASATQDAAGDAYRSHILKPDELASGAAASYLGYRLGLIFCSSTSLLVADRYSWRTSYLMILGIYCLGSVIALFGSPPTKTIPSKQSMRLPSSHSFLAPLREFLRRKNSVEILGFILLYKMNEIAVTSLETTFLLQLGFTNTEIGKAISTFGLIATLASVVFGTHVIKRFSIRNSLFTFGALQGLSEISFYLLAKQGTNAFLLRLAILGETFSSAMGYMALTVFFMKLCHPRYTASQLALFTSIMAITRTLLGISTGWLAEVMGWEMFLLFGILLVLPSLLLLSRYHQWKIPE
jgi:PAT family beta-lactamase induction signal transducer AmpG